MRKTERQNAIISMLQKDRSVKIKDVAEKLRTSIITLRRDFDELEEAGLLHKVYGGAILPKHRDQSNRQPGFEARVRLSIPLKKKLAAAAAEYVRSSDVVYMDFGTTCFEAAKAVKDIFNLTVVTNSFPILEELSKTDGLTLYALGGFVRKDELATCGSAAQAALASFHIDTAIISAGAVSEDLQLKAFNRDSADLTASAIEQAAQTVLIAESSKFGLAGLTYIAPLSSIDVLITDSNLPDVIREEVRKAGVELVIVEA